MSRWIRKNSSIWRLVNPQNRKPSAYRLPVRQDETGRWTSHSEVGLRGGAPELPGGRKYDTRDYMNLMGINPTEQQVVNAIFKRDEAVRNNYDKFNLKTKTILKEAQDNTEMLKGLSDSKRFKLDSTMRFTNKKLKDYAAHAAVMFRDEKGAVHYHDGFVNLPGKLQKKNMFPGVEPLSKEDISALKGEYGDPFGYYRVKDLDRYIAKVSSLYSDSGTPLHPYIENKIRRYIQAQQYIIPTRAGIAGLHAEVQASNFAIKGLNISSYGALAERFRNTYIFTQRLVGKEDELGKNFAACANCAGVISFLADIMTGREAASVTALVPAEKAVVKGESLPSLFIGIAPDVESWKSEAASSASGSKSSVSGMLQDGPTISEQVNSDRFPVFVIGVHHKLGHPPVAGKV